MHHQPAMRMHGQALLAQPGQPVLAIGGLQDGIERVAAVRLAHTMRHGQQVQVMVAQQAGHRALQRTQAAQHAQAVRPAIDEVAQEVEVVPRGGEIEGLQQPLKRITTALQVANEVDHGKDSATLGRS